MLMCLKRENYRGGLSGEVRHFSDRYYFTIFTLLLMVVSFSCSSKGKSDQISEDLADRLTDNLEFEGGTLEEGDPPDGSDSVLAPQITSIKAPEEFQLGSAFSTIIKSDYTSRTIVARLLKDSKDDPVVRVIIRVVGSQNGYFVVPVEMLYDTIELAGILDGDEQLRDVKFKLEFALQTASGLTGGYQPLNFDIKDTPPQQTANPMSSLDLGDDTDFKDSGRPEGSNDPFAPQILGVNAPEKLIKGEEFVIDLLTNFSPSASIVSAVMTFPLSTGYFELKGTMVETVDGSAYRIKGNMDSPEINVGDYLTFLFALKSSEEKVGTYKSWSVQIISGIADGDEDVADGDGLPEGIFMQPMSFEPSSNTALNQTIRSRQTLGSFKKRLFILE